MTRILFRLSPFVVFAAFVMTWLARPVLAVDPPGIVVDKEKKTITFDAKIAPRKLEYLKGEVYPLEVIATWPHPKGKKAHETIVTTEVMPSDIHKAIESLGFKAGKPVMGGENEVPEGPEFNVYLGIPEAGGIKKVSIDKCMVDIKSGKTFPKDIKFRFTGSKMVQEDPNKPDLTYGADSKSSGTFMAIFPVTDMTVFQTSLTMKYEKFLKLETNPKVVPKEGTPVKVILQPTGK
ncbi:MAG TPA: YdjY domain-containing protein [Gemmataceae bacterium]|jgi:hypothetical protein|nr:YdjY domain-containing protein [Gemmataceae bacterium]